MPRRTSRRTVLIAGAATLTIVGGVVAADLGTTHAVTTRLQNTIACNLGVQAAAVSARVDGFVPFELIAASIGHASATVERSGATIRVDLHEVPTRGGAAVGSVTAMMTVPWKKVRAAAAERGASGQGTLPSGLTLGDDDGRLVASLKSRPGIKVAFDLDHDRSSITFTAAGLVVMGKSFPLPSGLAGRDGAFGELAKPHTITPSLPKGAVITDAASTTDGLRVAVKLDAHAVGSTGGDSCDD